MYKIHTYASLIFCIPLVIACFTGSVLVYKDEINNILMPGVIYVAKNSDENEQKSRLKFDELREKIEKEYPHHEIVGWNIDADHNVYAPTAPQVMHANKPPYHAHAGNIGFLHAKPNPLPSITQCRLMPTAFSASKSHGVGTLPLPPSRK